MAKKVGRPSSFDPDYNDQASKLCLLGATDAQLGDFFGVDERTINRWKVDHPEFCQSLKDGKAGADARVAGSLYQRALGYEHDAVKIVVNTKTGSEYVVPYVKHYPPDTTAGIFWLKNRRPDVWRDRHQIEHGGPDGGPITLIQADEAKERLFERLAGIAERVMERLDAQAIAGHGDGNAAGSGAGQLPPGANGAGATSP